jgi:hypothetical protein
MPVHMIAEPLGRLIRIEDILRRILGLPGRNQPAG